MTRETGIQFQVELYQRLKKWYLILPCLIPSIIRDESRVKWVNPGKGIPPTIYLGIVAIEKGAFGSPSTALHSHYDFICCFLRKFLFLHTILSLDRILSVATTPGGVDLGVMAMKGYFAFLKAQGLEPHQKMFNIISRTLVEGVLPLCRHAIGVFCGLSRLGYISLESKWCIYTVVLAWLLLEIN